MVWTRGGELSSASELCPIFSRRRIYCKKHSVYIQLSMRKTMHSYDIKYNMYLIYMNISILKYYKYYGIFSPGACKWQKTTLT